MLDVPDSPAQKSEKEAALMGKLQQHVLTMMRPFVDHVDQLFTAVESLGGDLAEEQARSRVQHDATSLRLDNLDKTISLHLAEFAKAPQDPLKQRLVQLVEERLEEQQLRLTALVSDLRQELNRELLPLVAESNGPLVKLFEQQEEVRHVMSRVEDRLDASVCDWHSTVDALRQEFYSNSESLNRNQSSDDALQHNVNLNAERIAYLDAQLQELVPSVDAMREAVGAVQPTLNKLAQEQFDAFDRRLGVVESETVRSLGMKIAETQATAGALQLSLQHKTDIVQELAVRLSETNVRLAEKLEPAFEEQQRRVTELETRELEKASGIESKLSDGAASVEAMRVSMENMKQAVDEVTWKLDAIDCQIAEKHEQHGHNALNVAGGKAAASQLPSRFQRVARSPLPSSRILAGSAHADLGSAGSAHADLTATTASVSSEVSRRPHSSPRMRVQGNKICFQGLPTRPLVITTFPANTV